MSDFVTASVLSRGAARQLLLLPGDLDGRTKAIESDRAEVTRILDALDKGEAHASDLLPLIYDELRRLAARRLAKEKSGQTLQATALVHEAYLRLVGPGPHQPWGGRGHFFAAAAEAMRRILVDRARRRKALKRGGHRERIEFDMAGLACPELAPDLLALDDALVRLAARDRVKAELVKLLYFGGLTVPQAAEALGISHAAAKRAWSYARAWLRIEIRGVEVPPERGQNS